MQTKYKGIRGRNKKEHMTSMKDNVKDFMFYFIEVGKTWDL